MGTDRRRQLVRSTVLAVCGLAVLETVARTYAGSAAERRAVMPGDDIVERPQTVVTRAITIPAPPSEVWPWLLQVGWHRAGWYTAPWVDELLFPDNLPSADRLLEDHQCLRIGDFVPDGPPSTGCGFVVRDLLAPVRLVLHSTTHLPVSWRVHDRARVSWTWAFLLYPRDGGRSTRLVFRWRARTHPSWLTAAVHMLVVPADVWMSHDMLHGVRARVVVRSHAVDGSRESPRSRSVSRARAADAVAH